MPEKLRYLTKEETEAIYTALGVRKNIVETGSHSMGARDVARLSDRKAARRQFGAEIRALSTHQMELCILTDKLVQAALENRLLIVE